jgi:hypothetical protein
MNHNKHDNASLCQILSRFETVTDQPGPNPAIINYNAGAVKIYNATSTLVRSENKIIFFFFGNTI